MSKWMFYVMSWLLLALSIMLYQQIKSPSVEAFIIIKSLYVDEDGASLKVPIYMTVKGALTNKEAIMTAKLQNNVTQLSLSIEDVSLKQEEQYLQKTYYRYELTFSMPSLSDHLMMRDAVLHLMTIDHEYEFLIGHVERYIKQDSEPFMWEGIKAFRHMDVFSIESIEILTKSDIHSIWISDFIEAYLVTMSHHYQIQLSLDNVMVNRIPLLIEHEKGIEIISAVEYIQSPILLIQTEPFHEYYINELS
jgi:hypothetical protein